MAISRADRLFAKDGWLVLAGPMGAELVRRGVRWRGHGMLTDTDSVHKLYREYIEAGADVVRTNTFQLNRRIYLDVFRDEAHMAHIGAPGLDRRAVELTRRAVELATRARAESNRENVTIAGVMGPLEHAFRPDLAPEPERAQEEHAELANVLVEAGADLLLLESMNTLAEARMAAAAAAATGVPFWVSFVLGPDGLVLGGDLLAGAARAMRDQGAAAVLVNGIPARDVARSLDLISNGGVFGAMPMVGLYDPPSWKFEFFPRFCQTETYGPATLQRDAEGWIACGAKIVGSDGGAGPEHTAALAQMAGH